MLGHGEEERKEDGGGACEEVCYQSLGQPRNRKAVDGPCLRYTPSTQLYAEEVALFLCDLFLISRLILRLLSVLSMEDIEQLIERLGREMRKGIWGTACMASTTAVIYCNNRDQGQQWGGGLESTGAG